VEEGFANPLSPILATYPSELLISAAIILNKINKKAKTRRIY
jgi:hypothetical protein